MCYRAGVERVVLICAGLDPSGGAGLVADVATATARGLRSAAVATALTVQDSASCTGAEPVSPAMIQSQLAAIIQDLPIAAVKIGMLGSPEVARAVAGGIGGLAARGVPVVIDPVLRASAGMALLEGDPREALRPLAAMASLLTPNGEEAERLTGVRVAELEGQRAAARALRAAGWAAVLVKGGHVGGEEVCDLLLDGEGELALRGPRRAETPRGTGCALSTEIACGLALGAGLRQAVAEGRERVAARIAGAARVGRQRTFLGR
jgi:hydroxymethylpyrimidine/phosphomethylpyrimidine kinase